MESPIDENVLAAAPATDVDQLSPGYRQAFRQVVEDALQCVFDMDGQAASERAHAYFADSRDLGLFTYHRHPLQIATDLSPAADRALTEDETRRYLDFAKRTPDLHGLPGRAPPDEGSIRPIRTAW